MNSRTQSHLFGCLAVFCLGAAGNAAADVGGLDEAAYKAAEKSIATRYKADRKACARLKANAKDICVAEAKGKESVARARLEAQYEPSPEAERVVKDTQADADYAAAKERCDDKGRMKKACREEAEAAHEAAVRQAKVEKVERVNGLKAKSERQRKAASTSRG